MWGKRLVGRMLPAGSSTVGNGRCVMAGVNVAANVGDDLDNNNRDLGLCGGGRAGFITTSGAIPPCFIFSGAVLKGLMVGEVGKVGERGCVPGNYRD